MRNVAMRLKYDGTEYHGWQIQPFDRTVEGTIEERLRKLLKEPVKLTGCGRTDAGVHAMNYCANFRTNATIPAERLPYAINSLLPDDISVFEAYDAPEDFNAILSCEKKEYTYKIYPSRVRDPFLKNRAYFYPMRLNIGRMERAAAAFVGEHDFAAVRSVGTETKTTVRTIHWCEIFEEGGTVNMRVCADGFLYNMVRAIMGTVLYCSEGKIDPEEIPRLLETRDRRLTGPTVPPQGLYLTRIWYGGEMGNKLKNLQII